MSFDISIIIPVYNGEKFIKRCLESITNYSYENYEIIVVDDGSTDNTACIIDEYSRNNKRIKTIHKINEGQGIARNEALEIAKGKYVTFLDADDYHNPELYEEVIGCMEKTNADMCTFGYAITDTDGRIIRIPKVVEREYVDAEIMNEFSLHFFGDDPGEDNLRGCSGCMSVFKRSIIEANNIKFPSERVVLSEDTAFCLEYIKYIKKIITISKVYYYYITNDNSFCHSYKEDRIDKTLKMAEYLREYAIDNGILDKVRIRLAMYVWVNLMTHMKSSVKRLDNRALKGVVRDDIKSLCKDENIGNSIGILKNSKLPIKQKILLNAVLSNNIELVILLCGIKVWRRQNG